MKIISFWSDEKNGTLAACSRDEMNIRRFYRRVTMPSRARLARLANNHQHRIVVDDVGVCVFVYSRRSP